MRFDLEERRSRTEAVITAYRGRAFSWTGRRTCVHLARAQMRAMGHKPPRVPDLRSELAAARALRATGHGSLEQLLDALLPRIAPAAMLVGDLALMAGDGAFEAIVVSAGGKVIGYHGEQLARGIVNIEPIGPQPFIAAWRL